MMFQMILFLCCIGILGAGEDVIVGSSGAGDITVTNYFTTIGPARQESRCVIKAYSNAVGHVGFGEGFSGNFEGDAGSKSFRVIEFIQIMDIDMTITNTREVPNNVTAKQRFYHTHIPYDLPYVRVELEQWVDCLTCTPTDKK